MSDVERKTCFQPCTINAFCLPHPVIKSLTCRKKKKKKKEKKTEGVCHFLLKSKPHYRVSEELWTEVPDIVQEAVIKTIPKKKKCKKGKMVV